MDLVLRSLTTASPHQLAPLLPRLFARLFPSLLVVCLQDSPLPPSAIYTLQLLEPLISSLFFLNSTSCAMHLLYSIQQVRKLTIVAES